MNKRNTILAVTSAALVLVLVMVAWFSLGRADDPSDASSQPPSTSPSATRSTPAASPSPSPSKRCTTTTDGFVPTRFTFEGGLEADEKVLSLPLDDKGLIPAPPPSEERTAAWWNGGPKPGTAGKTVLSIHTYRNGKALGNEMYADGTSHLQPGDLIKLHGDNGEVACYEFTEAKKIRVDEYDPDSDMMVDDEGDSEVVIIICWDFDKSVDESTGADPWHSRVLFYGKLV
ncbi:class F sortase [uncultured Tessaracoccus sp.]|uniref:class F sortase n=1 Tax=uncultured Tessaracoccus sp. TaxID=905023 RepID=UPI0025D4488B|nr:class F sortase [uncultured Tessaracoccus sp.]